MVGSFVFSSSGHNTSESMHTLNNQTNIVGAIVLEIVHFDNNVLWTCFGLLLSATIPGSPMGAP